MIDQGKLKPQEFKEGDWAWSVKTGWEKCKVDRQYLTNPPRPIVEHCGCDFEEDGRSGGAQYPFLLSVENAALLGFYPPKKKKKVVFERWFNVYSDYVSWNFRTKEQADKATTDDRIDCQMKTFEIEVDSDE